MLLKEYIPNFLKPLAHEVKFRFYKNEDEEKLRDEVEDIQSQWKSIIANSKEFINTISTNDENQHILFVTGYGVGTHFLTIEPMIAMSLFARGCKISSLYCNKSLPSCEFNSVGNNKPNALSVFKRGLSDDAISFRCNKCKTNIESTYDILPIELNGLEKYLTNDDYTIAEKASQSVKFESFREYIFNGVKVGEEAFASILRVTFMGEVSDTDVNRYLVKRFIMSGVLTSIAYEKAYLDLKPDRVVCIHGIYQTHGLAVKVAHQLNIPVVVLGGGGIRKDTVVICHNETYHHQLVNENNSIWEQFTLSEEEISKTLSYAFTKRNAGSSMDYLAYHPNPVEDSQILFRECNIDNSRKIISLYTNVIWDAQILYEGNAFKDIFEWIETSIVELGKNNNIWVIIRIHPAESKGGNPTKQPMWNEIYKRFPTLPENVRIIPPESDLSSYTLVEESYVNIIYGTKMGLEIALMKKPLVICGETFSRNKGYGLDITSKEQYIELCKNIHDYQVDVEEKLDIALQYAHYFYFRKMIDLPFETNVAGKVGSGKKLKFNSLEDLSEGKNEGIDTICNGIMHLKPFYIGAK
ncbi:hypothetical protein [Aliarcobacter butzleri]|uniref:hypothetical protein n=1 Tax=Aliarcobacter butzleri TaxID=28197 RepID=UPI000F46718F|nr:hypothetical protein [Aliarcobacter butzleri]